VDGVHVAVVIYGAVTKIVFNLDQLHDVSSMNKALGHVVRVGGVAKVGLALQTIKDSVFEAKSRQGVPKRLIHMMCGKTIDDVVGAAKRLHDVGVLVIAAGTCIAVSKPELCIIGSPPTCENALIMKTMNPVSAPGCEFAAKILKGRDIVQILIFYLILYSIITPEEESHRLSLGPKLNYTSISIKFVTLDSQMYDPR